MIYYFLCNFLHRFKLNHLHKKTLPVISRQCNNYLHNTNSLNLGSVNSKCPYSGEIIKPFFISLFLYTLKLFDAFFIVFRIASTLVSLVFAIATNNSLSPFDSSLHIFSYTYSSRYWSYSGNISCTVFVSRCSQ